MQKIFLAIASSLLLAVSAGVNADSDIPRVEIIQSDQLPAELIDLKCHPKELQRTIDEKQRASASTEYQTMLSYAQRRSDDAYSRIMANRSLRERLASEGEAALFISQDFSRVAVASFKQPANVNTFLKGGAACLTATGNICIPALFFDGEKTHCLLFTKQELGG